MKVLNKHFNKNVVEEHTKHNKQEIAEKLNPAAQDRPWENHKPIKKVTGGE